MATTPRTTPGSAQLRAHTIRVERQHTESNLLSSSRRQYLCTAVGLILASPFLAAPSGAQTWRIVPSIAWESTFTNNVNLSANRQSDWVNQFTPAVRIDEKGSHSRIAGSVSLAMLVYARTSENNYLAPSADLTGRFEAIDNFLFVDASANVSQQYQSPFGTRSTSLANATGNRYTNQVYSVSPYIEVDRPDGVSYGLRQRSIWSNGGGASGLSSTDRNFTSNIDGHFTRQSGTTGLGVQYNRSDIYFPDIQNAGRDTERTEIARGQFFYRPDYNVQLSASVGYENNQFFFSDERGTTYGAGIVWHPTDRTNLDASWEHRFFGTGYHVDFSHHTALTLWSLNAFRDITSYPQQIANIPAGGDVNLLLNNLYATRVIDPIQRQTFVDQLIHNRGLPSQLSTPLAIYAQQLTLVESVTGSVGLLGARNSVFFTAYYTKDEPATRGADELAPLLDALLRTRQTGTSIAWTHQLAPLLTLAASADASRASDSAGLTTRFYSTRLGLSFALSPLTTAYSGVRYQRSTSNNEIASNFDEVAVFVGLTHTFR